MVDFTDQESESDGPASVLDVGHEISALDAATYIYDVAGQLAAMSRDQGFSALAASLERARDLAARAAAETR